MNHNTDIHRRRSIRLKGYDYSQSGAYFVTVCAQDRECLFGNVVDGEIRVNDTGRMVHDIWHKIPGHFPDIAIDEFIVMPNHVHGIVVIVEAQFIAPSDCDTANRAAINHPKQNLTTKQGVMNHAPTVGGIVRAFKARCTHTINQFRNTPGDPVWQRNYYEHIIRHEEEMNRIRQYIADNPLKWTEDEYNPGNITRKGLVNQPLTNTSPTTPCQPSL